MSISIWINEANGWIFCEILNSGFLRLGRRGTVTHTSDIHRAQQTSREHVQGGKMSSHKSGEQAAPALTQPEHHKLRCRAPAHTAAGWSQGQQTIHHILLWHSSFLLSAPRSPPNGAEKPSSAQNTVMVPKGTCKCLPLATCAAGRWHSRAHTHS